MRFVLFLFLAATPGFEEAFRAGLLALQRNDLPAAATNLESAAKLEPNNGRVWLALAQTYRKLNQDKKADDAAVKAATLGASDAVVLSTLVIYYSEAGQQAKAAEAQAKYSVTVPKDSAAREKAESLYFEIAQPFLNQGKFSDAIKVLNQARERLPNSAQLELALGVAYYGLRRFDDAAGAFLRTIEIDPEVDKPYLFLGKFLNQIPGRLPEVTRQFVRFEAAHPESATGYVLHAKALNTQSIEGDTTRQLLERAISLNDHDPAAHFELGVVFDRTRHFPEAAHEFERSAELDPAEPATHYRLARVYDRLGKTDAARLERERHAKLVEAQESAK